MSNISNIRTARVAGRITLVQPGTEAKVVRVGYRLTAKLANTTASVARYELDPNGKRNMLAVEFTDFSEVNAILAILNRGKFGWDASHANVADLRTEAHKARDERKASRALAPQAKAA